MQKEQLESTIRPCASLYAHVLVPCNSILGGELFRRSENEEFVRMLKVTTIYADRSEQFLVVAKDAVNQCIHKLVEAAK